jgi:beta-galactosidase
MNLDEAGRLGSVSRRAVLKSCAALAPAIFFPQAFAAGAKGTFAVVGDHFELNGKPFQVIAGEMHYARIPREYWRNRVQMAKAMGLNTIATYVFWNVHEPRPGEYEFSGNYDLAAFIRTIEAEGLHVLLRAGPYSCAEWEFGGFPAWLLKDPRMKTALRTNDDAFMVPAARWMKRLADETSPLLIANGGPIIAVQVENEYGNFSNDHAYMQHMLEIFQSTGYRDALLYTVDPSKALQQGCLEGILAGVNFGTGSSELGLSRLAAMRPGAPLFATEYWPGWFDLWGHPHETRPVAPQLKDIENVLGRGGSINIYMFHGGTSFGMMAGASASTGNYRGNVTSYDYDAPLDEAGHTTPKFFAYRDLILKYTKGPALPVPAVAEVVAIPEFTLNTGQSLWSEMHKPVASEMPLTMEEVDQAYGYIVYSTVLPEGVEGQPLVIDPVHDFAQVYVHDGPADLTRPVPLDSSLAGTLDRHYNQTTVNLSAKAGARLDILVENTGRLNSTRNMRTEWKGIKSATLGGKPLTGWRIWPLPMGDKQNAGPVQYDPHPRQSPHFFYGSFNLDKVGDAFLDTSALGKGLVWVNGRAIGRVWNVGPQVTLYLPGPWLKQGRNEVVVLDLFMANLQPKLVGRLKPILDGATPGYADDPERNKKPAANAEFGPKLDVPNKPKE